jgi:hypothetical protein
MKNINEKLFLCVLWLCKRYWVLGGGVLMVDDDFTLVDFL